MINDPRLEGKNIAVQVRADVINDPVDLPLVIPDQPVHHPQIKGKIRIQVVLHTRSQIQAASIQIDVSPVSRIKFRDSVSADSGQ